MSYGYFAWPPRQTAAARRADAARRIRDAAKHGKPMSPIVLEGRTISRTFWGKAWCDNLERYRDFAYRLERGRSYLRSGSVIDLRIEPGKIAATVSGSSLYDITITIDAIPPPAWTAIHHDCAGSIGSRVDLLAGKLSDPVMTRLCADRTGLFPPPSAIRFTCSCPDYAIMCKHVAATMYGVGARLDHAPDLLFTLRRVSIDDLVASALSVLPLARPHTARVLATGGLAAMFGIELADAPAHAADGDQRSKPSRKSAPAAVKQARTSKKRRPAKAKPAAPAARPAKPARSQGRLDRSPKQPSVTKSTRATRAPSRPRAK